MGEVVNICHIDHFRNIDLCFLRQLLALTSKLKKMTASLSIISCQTTFRLQPSQIRSDEGYPSNFRN